MGMTLSGINIYTKNPAQSFNFYKGLGWEVVEEGDLETDWFGAEFRPVSYTHLTGKGTPKYRCLEIHQSHFRFSTQLLYLLFI